MPPKLPAEINLTPGTIAAALTPAAIAAETLFSSIPSMTISYTAFDPAGILLSATFSRRVGQYFSFVDAGMNLYFRLPTFEPLATIPPGKLVIVPGNCIDRFDCCLCAQECGHLVLSHDKEIAAGNTLYDAEFFFANIFSLHDRDDPAFPSADFFLVFVTVTKEVKFDLYLFFSSGDPVENSSRRCSQDTFGKAFDNLLFEFLLARTDQDCNRRAFRQVSGLQGYTPSIPASHGQPIADVANPVASVAAFLAHSS